MIYSARTYRFRKLFRGVGDCLVDHGLNRRARLGSIGHLHVRGILKLLLLHRLDARSDVPRLDEGNRPKGKRHTVCRDFVETGLDRGGYFPAYNFQLAFLTAVFLTNDG